MDRFTKVMLVVIAVLLGIVALRPVAQPLPVRAQSGESYPFYVEPGYTTLRKPDGTAQMYGKVVIDMRNGDIWGFPTLTTSPYPVDTAQTKPPKSSPMYLGKFMFESAVR
jgi:hypothetical protein